MRKMEEKGEKEVAVRLFEGKVKSGRERERETNSYCNEFTIGPRVCVCEKERKRERERLNVWHRSCRLNLKEIF